MEQAKKRAQCVLMEHVGSMEYYQSPQQDPKQVFSDINFEALEGEVWAILGTSAFEVRLLLEIIANARPYKDGRCVLAQKGMMRKKRTILPHVYYIGSTNMLFTNMNVLEYLMYITAREQGDAAVRQKRILEKIMELNMGYVALSVIGNLTPSERSVVTLLVSLFTESKLIIWNLARLEYDERSLQAIAAICEEIRKQKRTLLFSTFDYQLIERCATHIAPLYDGRLLYTGTVEAFVQTWDHLSTIIQDAHITAIRHAIETAHSDYTVLERDQTLYVWDQEQKTDTYHSIWKLLTEHQLHPDSICRHPLCVENAWKEIRNHHDLQP